MAGANQMQKKHKPHTEPILCHCCMVDITLAQVLLSDIIQIQARLVGPVSKVPLVLLRTGVPIFHSILSLFQGHYLQTTGGSPVRHCLGGPVTSCRGLGWTPFFRFGQGRGDALPFMGSPFALSRF